MEQVIIAVGHLRKLRDVKAECLTNRVLNDSHAWSCDLGQDTSSYSDLEGRSRRNIWIVDQLSFQNNRLNKSNIIEVVSLQIKGSAGQTDDGGQFSTGIVKDAVGFGSTSICVF